jgi:hypothetical protein
MVAEKVKSRIRLQNSSRFDIRQRYPTNAHWDSLTKLQNNLIDPKDFTQRWEVTYKDLARICSCSKRTVERWFSSTDYHSPSLYHRFCLGLADKLWTDLSIRREFG